jgi:uncharacterized protein
LQRRLKTPKNGKIWIDLDNSPHVPFFAPIIKELENHGYRLEVTARDCFQVCGLADLHGLKYKKIGRHYGKNKVAKVLGTLYRSAQLLGRMAASGAVVAVSHGSRSQLIAAKIAHLPYVQIGDYEHAQGLPFFAPNVFVVAAVIAEGGITPPAKRTLTYPGIKEDVYVPDFLPDDKILDELEIEEGKILATIRPPATEAHYHNSESDRLFEEVVEFLGRNGHVQMVILPRNEKKQGDFIKSRWGEWCELRKIIVPDHVVNGLNLVWHSDLVVSGGGTMNREAAALGVPVYSIFRGKIGAVDRYLCETNRLTLLEKPEDVRLKIKLARRVKALAGTDQDRVALHRIVEVIEGVVQAK